MINKFFKETIIFLLAVLFSTATFLTYASAGENIVGSREGNDEDRGHTKIYKEGNAVYFSSKPLSDYQIRDNVTLADGGIGYDNITIQRKHNASLFHDVVLAQGEHALAETMTEKKTSEDNSQLSAVLNGRVANLVLLNDGIDLLSDKAMRVGKKQRRPIAIYTLGEGGQSHYKTSGQLETQNFLGAAGLSINLGNFFLSPFVEAGWGNYDSFNNDTNMKSIHAAGEMRYMGGGFLSRFEFMNSQHGFGYGEGILRVGQYKNIFRSADLSQNEDLIAYYKSKGLYYGASAGLGYLFNWNEREQFDFYGRYYWNHLSDTGVEIASTPIDFSVVNSQRLRIGGRYYYRVLGILPYVVKPYFGWAFDYAFLADVAGKTQANMMTQTIDKSDQLQGHTLIGEVGLSVQAMQPHMISFDMAVTGFVGLRNGIAGNISMKYQF